ncbi:MAG: tetratricopeptide repeat protein [Bacteroidia bacterium]
MKVITGNIHISHSGLRMYAKGWWLYMFICALSLVFISCKSSKNTTAASASGKSSKATGDGGSSLSDRQRIEFERYFFDANREKILGNYSQAESLLVQALHVYPGSSAATYELATIYAFRNNRKQALAFSKKAAQMEPKNIWYQMLYIDCLKENKMMDDAISVYQKLIKEYPDRLELYYELANLYIYKSKPSDAIKVYDKVEAMTGVSEDATLQKFKIYKAINNYEKALVEIQKLIKVFPKEAKYYGILGELYLDNGENEKAYAAYTDLQKVDPENPYVHLSLADYYRKLKQNDKSFNEIKAAFRSKDLDIDTKVKILLSYYNITESYTELRADAEELCKILVDVHSDDAKAFSIYGDFLYRDRNFEEARVQFRKAIALDKEKYALWDALLRIESELNDFSAMEKESKETIELFPNQYLPYFFNGVSNIQLKNYQQAVDVLNAGLEYVFGNEPLLSQFYANIGDAQNQLKNYAASDSAYTKALEIDGDNTYVLNNYAYYLSLRNSDLAKAEAMSKKSNELEPNNSSYQDTYGWILYQMKKYDDAKVWIGKALETGGKSNGTLLEHYGDVLYKLGETEEALKYWSEAKKAGSTTELIDKKIADKKLYE